MFEWIRRLFKKNKSSGGGKSLVVNNAAQKDAQGYTSGSLGKRWNNMMDKIRFMFGAKKNNADATSEGFSNSQDQNLENSYSTFEEDLSKGGNPFSNGETGPDVDWGALHGMD